jgi:Dolichyl-phosphate-mannose-protein mannosyltransferase
MSGPAADASQAGSRHDSRMNLQLNDQNAAPARSSGRASRPAVPVAPIALVAVGAFAVEMAVSARYGYHRDELYFLAAGRHLAFGYVDQPPITPLLARFSVAIFGNSLAALRVIPALALATLVVITAAMSRLLGAGRAGQILAALATATCAEYLAAMHLLTTTTPDFVFWALTLLLVLRLLTSQDRRWWLAIGICAGLAAQAKWNIAFLIASLAVGFAATPARRLVISRWFVLAAFLAFALAAPSVAWQAVHGWPNFAVFRTLQEAAWHNRATYWQAQIVYTGLALAPLWIGGLVWLLRSPQARHFRPAGIACATAIIWFFLAGGKAYYPGAVFTFLFAAGSVPLERRLRTWKPLPGRVRPAVLAGAVMVASGLVALPVALPVLPASALRTVPLQKINYDLGEMIGWPRLVADVARQYQALPVPLRRKTAIVTANYGEAGAIERYGPGLGLPQAYSGNNNFWLWGPPPAADTAAIVVNMDPAFLRREFASVRRLAVFRNGIGVADDEEGAVIYLATGLRSSWPRAWTAFRDFS